MVKVSELEEALLDYWVAKAMGYSENQMPRMKLPSGEWFAPHPHQAFLVEAWRPGGWHSMFEPSTRWDQGGSIIERGHICLQYSIDHQIWDAYIPGRPDVCGSGPTPLIAAMRCFVASRFGETVED